MKQHRTAFGFVLAVGAIGLGMILGTLTPADSWFTLVILSVGVVCAVISERRRRQRRRMAHQ
jgi:Flp pilus assembly protein TadB